MSDAHKPYPIKTLRPPTPALSPAIPTLWLLKHNLLRISDVLRLHALAEHGGIWMDATIVSTASFSWLHSIQVGVSWTGCRQV